MFKFWHHHGILGINARNLLYIKPLNKKAQIAFADDKLKTKQYLSARSINTAKLFGMIKNEAELKAFRFESLPESFALKPNAGYGGEGILIITGKEGDCWVTLKGERISKDRMLEHLKDILQGRYSITGGPDSVLFEQRLICHPSMETLGTYGLPDIRIIVFNMVPVMAMVRVPTPESGGRANLHSGGLGLGVDLAKGEITFNPPHPNFSSLKGTKIPFWDHILLLAVKIQQITTLGYLAVDIVIDRELGLTLLEINARAGLGLQIANRVPLRDRLDRVAGLHVKTPEKGVRLAQDLFGNKIERRIQALSGKEVIGLEEELILNLKGGKVKVLARMNPTMNKNYLDQKVFTSLAAGGEKLKIPYHLQNQRGISVFYPLEMQEGEVQALIGKKILSSFYLDVSKTRTKKKIPEPMALPKPLNPSKDPWEDLDQELHHIDTNLSLIARTTPLNTREERMKFFESKNYEPTFQYVPAHPQILEYKNRLIVLNIENETPLGKLFGEKRQHLLNRIGLMTSIGNDEAFIEHSQAYFGVPKGEILARAEEDLKALKPPVKMERPISTEEAAEMLQNFLKAKNLLNWQVKVVKGIVARCVIGSHNSLMLRKGVQYSKRMVEKIIAHEIETHIYSSENGKLQPYRIFSRGFAGYLKTQEGLAVYHQNQIIPDGTRDALLLFHTVFWAREMGFRAVYQKLLRFVSMKKAWRMTLKVKRGLTETSKKGAFLKNALYYSGYHEIDEYIKQGGNFAELFLGKITLHQLHLIRGLQGLVKPRYVP